LIAYSLITSRENPGQEGDYASSLQFNEEVGFRKLERISTRATVPDMGVSPAKSTTGSFTATGGRDFDCTSFAGSSITERPACLLCWDSP